VSLPTVPGPQFEHPIGRRRPLPTWTINGRLLDGREDMLKTAFRSRSGCPQAEPLAGRLLDGCESVREREHYGKGFKPASRSTAESPRAFPANAAGPHCGLPVNPAGV